MATYNVISGKGSFDVIQKLETAAVSTPELTDSFPATAQFEWEQTYKFEKKYVWIFNTHATNTIRYRIEFRPGDTAINNLWAAMYLHDGATAQNDIAPGKYQQVLISEPVDAIRVFIKNTTVGQQGTYVVQGTCFLAFLRG